MNRTTFLRSGLLTLFALGAAFAIEGERIDRFRQLDELLPTPNDYRTASGAPGHEYWQQRADYAIDVRLDESRRELIGRETITYHNHSPDSLRYLWLQVDANIYSPQSHGALTSLGPDPEEATYRSVQRLIERRKFDGSTEILGVTGSDGVALEYTIVDTMMRVDLPTPLAAGARVGFKVSWKYAINDHAKVRGRTGFENFEEDGNDIFELAQWFPRMCAYTDVNGWQHKHFLGRGEFTLEFGDYDVNITAPADHIVASTGVLQNADDVLTAEQRKRLEQASRARVPVFIVTPDEALQNEKERTAETKTWSFHADDVRDFAWATSRKFIWDAQGTNLGGRDVMAMSYYPKEGEPLWSQYSTHAILHTLEVYSKYTFPYPYPVAISVNGPVGGMEYPMICFNGPRPEKDGTYSKRTKYGLISVIIHEVGHNWFPMIVNSDERQWTWMDEGLNTFLQYLAEQEWEEDYPSWRGEPQRITEYMSEERQVPIMTNSESLLQFGNNAYAKPATALNILRESVMGRELFDFAFKEYASRWQFKRPEPADLFRTLEDASSVDLDWFFRGWFYTTDPVDIAIESVTHFRIDTRDPDIEKPLAKAEREAEPETLSEARNASLPKRLDAYPELADFYNEFDDLDVTVQDRDAFKKLVDKLKDPGKELLESQFDFYEVKLASRGGVVMPVILELHYTGGDVDEVRLPVEVWVQNSPEISKLLVTTRTIDYIVLDPHLETADLDTTNNRFPREIPSERMQLEQGERAKKKKKNPMQKAAGEVEEEEEAVGD